ncbi:hypothetical protein SAMN05428953_12638 [Mesorhizobium muleiense]|uniref:Uncharacterized protein n=1 Tax=Mesorhizobium muleiense TaxID=1004279 RepID=A0A1G9H1E2_9HYPH|nr:hypothetical protein [Mesorhizobium muleiense]SDL06778.1 hypothetical protein SAMN05428953_12638 [Mesorhizobium muleiense]
MMQLEDGKFYRSRIGDKTGPMRAGPDGNYFWLGRAYTKDGYYNGDGEPSRHDLIEEWKDQPPAKPADTDHVLQFFAFDHLPPALKEISRPFGQMAENMTKTLPRNPERTKALNKLLEAKDAAVRAFIAK